MSSTPPEQPTTPQQPGYGGGPNVNFNLSALMPTPGNAELVVYILAMILLAIIALASDRFDVNGWVTAVTAGPGPPFLPPRDFESPPGPPSRTPLQPRLLSLARARRPL